jgi:acyl-CoA thioester hydrolase
VKDDPGFAPETGAQVCEGFIRVRFHEVDALGHVNNAAYLNYLEQAAIDHAMLLGLDLETLRRLGGVFVARRHELVFLRPAYAGDVLRIVTWLGEPRGARVERRYLVFREDSAGLSAAMGACLVAADQVALKGTGSSRRRPNGCLRPSRVSHAGFRARSRRRFIPTRGSVGQRNAIPRGTADRRGLPILRRMMRIGHVPASRATRVSLKSKPKYLVAYDHAFHEPRCFAVFSLTRGARRPPASLIRS